ncbi:hypothetical protein [Chlamydia psittaci]|uniref:hypothetical protein n=1 Tax=Chlamydia psittaci TaxID=83554 RepID=UPI000206D79A|nr:hypothetical protein [Chlamydia psittaci]AFS19707.1 hypothetical protein B595_0748 [Chlamydia psittaci 84/55]EPJ16257.1 hypothetical protein CP02DC18_0034 [Chlamydia psittaci 02DC18]EPJ17812.1 hypothetical protein CP02DC22_0025 [Chlamydia psittaci 02DC22]EPJ20450.1 hypothetical protein CP02DC23_0379 [Chlamydia psittaci 02DC23]EPJ21374.1 hypothetical protein CP02DC21_0024 [Chlamydia psittaci 02DC21]EPJ21704.1 hypothetical protein CP03DC29_0818 [Chlamydia psittaci 03DC29]EPL00606.1 hypothet
MVFSIPQERISENEAQGSCLLSGRLPISSSALGILVSITAIFATAAVTSLSLTCSPQILVIVTALVSAVLAILCFVQIVFHIHGKKTSTLKLTNDESQPQATQLPEISTAPQLANAVFDELQQRLSRESDLETIEYITHVKANEFITDKDEWRRVFLKNPLFLLQSALSSWKVVDKQNEYVVLSKDYIGFRLVLAEYDFEELESEAFIAQQPQRCYIHQVCQTDLPEEIHNNRVIRTQLQDLTYVLPIVPNFVTARESTNPNSTKDADSVLYEIFKTFFINYYVALNSSVTHNKIITLQLLHSGYPDPRARLLETLALLCAIEQMRYTQTPQTHAVQRTRSVETPPPQTSEHKQSSTYFTYGSREASIHTPTADKYASPYGQLRSFQPQSHLQTVLNTRDSHATAPENTRSIPTPNFDEVQTFLVNQSGERDIPLDPNQTSVYILSPEDYWKIFVTKDTTSFPRESSPFGLLSHSQGSQENSMFNLNLGRFMETQFMIVANLTQAEIHNLSSLCKETNPRQSQNNTDE